MHANINKIITESMKNIKLWLIPRRGIRKWRKKLMVGFLISKLHLLKNDLKQTMLEKSQAEGTAMYN